MVNIDIQYLASGGGVTLATLCDTGHSLHTATARLSQTSAGFNFRLLTASDMLTSNNDIINLLNKIKIKHTDNNP